jgi:hypothetical protein
MSSHEASQIAFQKNRERLKAERLARRAAVTEAPHVVRNAPKEIGARVR